VTLNRFVRLSALVGGVLSSAGAAAQQSATVEAIRENQQKGQDMARAVQTAPDASSPYALPQPEVTLRANKDGTQATAVIGVSNPFWSWRTTFTTPISKNVDPGADTKLLSQAGLSNQANVDIAIMRLRVFRDASNIEDLRLTFCESHKIQHERCSDQAFSDRDRATFLNYGIYERPTIVTAHLQIGGQSFDYVAKGAAKKVTETDTSIAGGVSYGWLFLDRQSVFAVDFDVARDHSASKDSTSLCQPIATDVAGTTRCDTRTIGAPTAATKGTLTLDLRHVFTKIVPVPAQKTEGQKEPTPSPVPAQTNPVAGLSAQAYVQLVQHDAAIWGVNVPVYFLQKKADKTTSAALNGGASVGWNTKDKFVAQVFIGTGFSLLGKDISSNDSSK
jgi:hypothetical protein